MVMLVLMDRAGDQEIRAGAYVRRSVLRPGDGVGDVAGDCAERIAGSVFCILHVIINKTL